VIVLRDLVFIIMSCLLIGLQACQQPATQSDGELKVLTTIAPLYSFTANIVGDAAVVDNLIPSGVGPHEYSLSPGDARKVTESRIVVKNGVNLESWLHKLTGPAQGREKSAEEDSEWLIIVDTSKGVDIMDRDPHIWLSPKNAIIQVENIRDALTEADPDNSALYLKNAAEYIQRLRELDREIKDEIRTWDMRQFVAYHSAFRYFARDYGLEQAAVIKETPETEPSPRHIAEVIETIKSNDIKVIFTEPQFSHKIVASIAKDLNLQVYSLDTLETGELSMEWYEKEMRENLAVLKKALGGAKE
jgi:zinc/manganese transport system substrate-binding protein